MKDPDMCIRSRKMFGYSLVGLLLIQIASVASADLVALKRGSALDQSTDGGGAIHADFLALTASDIVNIDVDDTSFHDNSGDNNNRGAVALFVTSHDDKLFKFDLASLTGFAGSTVNRAELRLWSTGGNNLFQIARNLHHDVDEDVAVRNDPAGSSANLWGAGSNAEFGTGDHGTLVDFDSHPDGSRYQVTNVKGDVEGFADGTLTNFGWAVVSVNKNVASSEFGTDGLRPVLFLDYDPVSVPEPSAFLFGGLICGLAGIVKGRKSKTCKGRSRA